MTKTSPTVDPYVLDFNLSSMQTVAGQIAASAAAGLPVTQSTMTAFVASTENQPPTGVTTSGTMTPITGHDLSQLAHYSAQLGAALQSNNSNAIYREATSILGIAENHGLVVTYAPDIIQAPGS